MATTNAKAPLRERRTIDVVPDAERHGTPRSQFTLWFGANLQITAIVDGALAVVFGADALWAILGVLVAAAVRAHFFFRRFFVKCFE